MTQCASSPVVFTNVTPCANSPVVCYQCDTMCQQSGNLLPMSLTRYRTIRRDVSQNLAQICQYLSVRLLTMKICAVTEVTAYVGEGERPLASSETVSPGAQKFSKNLETTSNFQAGQE